ncbi:hypothetical protein ACFVH6_05380 [Spirillospora sp. NPDC127200]
MRKRSLAAAIALAVLPVPVAAPAWAGPQCRQTIAAAAADNRTATQLVHDHREAEAADYNSRTIAAVQRARSVCPEGTHPPLNIAIREAERAFALNSAGRTGALEPQSAVDYQLHRAQEALG